MKEKTLIKFQLVIDDKDQTTYHITRKVSPTELAYLHSVAHKALDVMLSGLIAGTRDPKKSE